MSDPYRSPEGSGTHTAPAPARPGRRNGLAVAALVTGVASLLLLWLWFVGIPLALVAIGLGIAALRRARGGAGGRGMAISGLVLGSVTVVIAGILVAVGVSILNSDEGKDLRSCVNNARTEQDRQDCSNRFNQDVGN
ncbi:hypothetical protein GCM10010371_33130 [Streptomyces subrutilus]|uniref:DUF4190 domain-containing protein n=1 Tax=Streptomyces subrutilus TaxID=36818 RepID=A0A5P2V025_9ACTN|nr:DUF4190 domain-containing protein [Streptomyces subrutilus]QEU82387.1 DUF4190 domain-containing protein [Streptomyces subrutilus]GGZ70553.1 hypothetical protein GCM10010371_33130 [Streptomyces subrutilus]